MTVEISRDTRLCMSLSARPGNFGTRFHNYLYRALGLDYVYKAFTTRDLPAAIGGIRALGIRGCAVSMPFKEACIPCSTRSRPRRRRSIRSTPSSTTTACCAATTPTTARWPA